MEEKRRDAGSHSPAATIPGITYKAGDAPATEPPAQRRRGSKRKSSSSSAPAKRHAREKAAAAAAAAAAGAGFSLFPHNGPLTRARQLSDSNAAIEAVRNEQKMSSSMAVEGQTAEGREKGERERRKEHFEVFEAAIEAEFEAIRSRGEKAHVVPVPAGWFSWTDIHPVEKQTLHSFFSGKSESRTPELYMEIRNWILKRYHANPGMNIELKDLSELSIGDLDAKQEVMEFLDHWGLINYNPSLLNEPAKINANRKSVAEKEENKDSLIEKLFRFEDEESCPQLPTRSNTPLLATAAGLFSDSTIAEELVKQEGPAVEYHCNSCSADCSRKRYLCQKQADFDLCTECYNNGKFGSGMSPSDFILMEPGEASGASGGKWTDQETLLLLEALELYKENWNEIAEHVATKTKAHCILHFLQMPIEDSFLDYDDSKDDLQRAPGPASNDNDASDAKDNSEAPGGTTDKDNLQLAESRNSEDRCEQPDNKTDKIELPESKTDTSTAQRVITPMETSNTENAQVGKITVDRGDEIVLKALKEAFDTVGCPLTSEDKLSFAEAGNPVMALAAFLTRLVEPGVATASARSSLKTMSMSSSGSQLAARHCFLLEDPPDDKKEQITSESTATGNTDPNTPRMTNQGCEEGKEINHNLEESVKPNEVKSMEILDGVHSRYQGHEKAGSISGEHLESPSKTQDVGPGNSQVAHEPDQEESQVPEKPDVEKSHALQKQDEDNPEGSEKADVEKFQVANPEMSKVAEKPDEKSQAVEKSDEDKSEVAEKPDEEESQVEEKPDEEKSQVMEKPDEEKSLATEKPDEEKSQATEKSDEEKPQGAEKPDNSMQDDLPPADPKESADQCSLISKDVSESDSIPQLKMDQQEIMQGDKFGDDRMEVDKAEDLKPMETTKSKEDQKTARLKRAALATISSAAVKAKLLANQEEDEIRQLATLLIEKQMCKLEIKLSFFTEMENAIMRVREQLDRSRQKLFNERAQIIASRLGLSASSSRGLPSSFPMNRMPPNLLNTMLRAPVNTGNAAQRPPMPRPVMTSAPTVNSSAPPDAAGGGTTQSSAHDKTSVGAN